MSPGRVVPTSPSTPRSTGSCRSRSATTTTASAYPVHANFFTTTTNTGAGALAFANGEPFGDLFDAVIGADVAQAFGYHVGDEIVVAHGVGSISFIAQGQAVPVAGMAKTGTPVDRTVHVSLAIEAIHVTGKMAFRCGRAPLGERGAHHASGA